MAINILSGLVSYHELSETAGNDRVDSQGSNDLAEVGPGVPINQAATLYTNGANSTDFSNNGCGSYQEHLQKTSPTGMSPGSGSFTVGGWVQWTTDSCSMSFVSRFESSGNDRQFVLWYLLSNNAWRFDVSSDGLDDFAVNDDEVFVGSTTLTRFVLAWYNGDDNTINISVNNTAPVSAAGPTAIFSSAAPYEIGNSFIGSNTPLVGKAQGVGYWNRVLTSDERTFLYNSGDGRAFNEFGADESEFFLVL